MLIGLVLLHSGKGGGLSDMFGGSVGATAWARRRRSGTSTASPWSSALIFAFTVVALSLMMG